jgi:hypothetical protein
MIITPMVIAMTTERLQSLQPSISHAIPFAA